MGTGRCITINFTAVDNKYPNTDEEQGGKVFKRYNLRLNTTIKRERMFILNNYVILIMQ